MQRTQHTTQCCTNCFGAHVPFPTLETLTWREAVGAFHTTCMWWTDSRGKVAACQTCGASFAGASPSSYLTPDHQVPFSLMATALSSSSKQLSAFPASPFCRLSPSPPTQSWVRPGMH